MNLIDENIEKESEEKQKKVTKLIITVIAILVALVIVILLYSAIKKKNTLTLNVNGEKKSFNSTLFLMADKKKFRKSESGEIYISVRELTNILGDEVGYFNDEYNGKGEDVTKCHIKTDNEYTSYVAGSSTIYKVRDNKAINDEIRKNKQNNRNNNEEEEELLVSDTEYEYFNIDGGVIYENNEIYATKSAIELGFNVKIIFDEKNKSISVYTLDGLAKRATDVIGASVVSDDIAYYNKKLFKYGYALVKSASGDYGIQDFEAYQEGNYVLSCKYSDIKFIEGLNCLIVTTSDKNEKGILKLDINTSNVITVVDPGYQEINQITDDGTLFVIKENGKYGILTLPENIRDITDENIIKRDTKTVLKCEYQTIGLENYTDYAEMDNRYLINGKYIPIKLNDKWGIATKDGGSYIIPQYDTIGCNIAQKGKAVICVPELRNNNDAIVFGNLASTDQQQQQQNNSYYYFIVDTAKKERINNDVTATEVYSLYQNNSRVYYLVYIAVDGTQYPRNIYEYYGVPSRTTNTNIKVDNDNKTTE